MRILFLEDEEAIRGFVRINLKRNGMEVTEAEDGETALELAKSAVPPFDIALLDVMLPTISGFEVCEQLRQLFPRMGIIMLTAKSQEEDKIRGLELGADDYVQKPFSPGELIARLNSLKRRMMPFGDEPAGGAAAEPGSTAPDGERAGERGGSGGTGAAGNGAAGGDASAGPGAASNGAAGHNASAGTGGSGSAGPNSAASAGGMASGGAAGTAGGSAGDAAASGDVNGAAGTAGMQGGAVPASGAAGDGSGATAAAIGAAASYASGQPAGESGSGGYRRAPRAGDIASGPFLLSATERRLWKDNVEIVLTPTEWTLVKLLMEREGEGLSRDDILNGVWGRHYVGDLKIVDVNIRRIRQKIEIKPSDPKHIETLWGYGYRWNRGDGQ